LEDEGIEKKPFVSYTLDKDKDNNIDIFTVRLNKEERVLLEDSKQLLQQGKDSTCFKQLAKIGYTFVLHDKKMMNLLVTILDNKRKNKDRGVDDFVKL